MTDVPPPRTKKLDRKYLEHLAGLLRPIVDKDFEGNATAFAKHVGISQPQIAQVLRTDGGDRGVGIVVLMQLRKHLRMTIDELLGLQPLPGRVLPTQELVAAVIEALDRREAAALKAAPKPDGEPPPRLLPPAPKRKKLD